MKLDKEFLEKVASAAAASGLVDIAYGAVDTPVGRLLVAQTSKGICRVAFEEEEEGAVLQELALALGPRVVASDAETAAARDALAAYLEGDALRFDLKVDMRLVGSDFHRKVLTRLRKVGRGQVMTYGDLASAIGHPRAARATGTALAQNPIPVIVPCHRVLPASGGVGNYGGQPWRKRFLLELEGAPI